MMRTIARGAFLFAAMFAALPATLGGDWLYPTNDRLLGQARVGALLFAAAIVGYTSINVAPALPRVGAILGLGSAFVGVAVPVLASLLGVDDVVWIAFFAVPSLVAVPLAIVLPGRSVTDDVREARALRDIRALALFATTLAAGAALHVAGNAARGLAVDVVLLVESVAVLLALAPVALALSAALPLWSPRAGSLRSRLRGSLPILLTLAAATGIVALREFFVLQGPLIAAAALLALAARRDLRAQV